MTDLVRKYIKGTQFMVFCIFMPLTWLGFAYEYSYFKQLNLVSNDYLGLRHYFYSGAFWIGQILIGAFIFSSVKRFFSKEIHVDQGKEVLETVSKLKFTDATWIFRAMVIFTFVYWLLSFLEITKDWYPNLMGLMWFMVLWNLSAYFFAMATGEKHTYATFTVMFAIALTMTMSASGFLHARHELNSQDPVLRDDGVVLVKREGDELKVAAKSISVPVPYIDSLLDKVFGR